MKKTGKLLYDKHKNMLNFLVINNPNYTNEISLPSIILPKIKGFMKPSVGVYVGKESLLYVVGGNIIITML